MQRHTKRQNDYYAAPPKLSNNQRFRPNIERHHTRLKQAQQALKYRFDRQSFEQAKQIFNELKDAGQANASDYMIFLEILSFAKSPVPDEALAIYNEACDLHFVSPRIFKLLLDNIQVCQNIDDYIPFVGETYRYMMHEHPKQTTLNAAVLQCLTKSKHPDLQLALEVHIQCMKNEPETMPNHTLVMNLFAQPHTVDANRVINIYRKLEELKLNNSIYFKNLVLQALVYENRVAEALVFYQQEGLQLKTANPLHKLNGVDGHQENYGSMYIGLLNYFLTTTLPAQRLVIVFGRGVGSDRHPVRDAALDICRELQFAYQVPTFNTGCCLVDFDPSDYHFRQALLRYQPSVEKTILETRTPLTTSCAPLFAAPVIAHGSPAKLAAPYTASPDMLAAPYTASSDSDVSASSSGYEGDNDAKSDASDGFREVLHIPGIATFCVRRQLEEETDEVTLADDDSDSDIPTFTLSCTKPKLFGRLTG